MYRLSRLALFLQCDRSWTRLRFEIEYAPLLGIATANSYLIQADKIALIDPPGETLPNLLRSVAAAP